MRMKKVAPDMATTVGTWIGSVQRIFTELIENYPVGNIAQ